MELEKNPLEERELEQASAGYVGLKIIPFRCPVCGWNTNKVYDGGVNLKAVEEEHKRCRPDCTGKVRMGP